MSEGVSAAKIRPGFHVLRIGERCKVTEVGATRSGALIVVKGLRPDGSAFESRYMPNAVVTVVYRPAAAERTTDPRLVAHATASATSQATETDSPQP